MSHSNYIDKENCNSRQVKPFHKPLLQPKLSTTTALSERMDDVLTETTMDSSPLFDHNSDVFSLSSPLNLFVNHPVKKACLHTSLLTRTRSYCRECGVFVPKSGASTYREEKYAEKLATNPDDEYEVMLGSQSQNRTYTANAPHLKYRKTLTDWIFQVSQDLKFSPDTTCAIISYVDTILCKVQVSKENLQLVILSCLILAAKFSETDNKVPPLREAYKLCQGAYSLEVFKKSEHYILEQLDWNIRTISPYQFVHFYLSKGCIFSSDQVSSLSADSEILTNFRKYCECFVNLSMDNYEFNKFSANIIACAAVACTRKLLGLPGLWNAELEELTQVSWEAIEPCFNELYAFFDNTYPGFVFEGAKDIVVENGCLRENKVVNNVEDDSLFFDELDEKTRMSPIHKYRAISKSVIEKKSKMLPALKKKASLGLQKERNFPR